MTEMKVNGHMPNGTGAWVDLDPTKLVIERTAAPRALPATDGLQFGTVMSDHMLIAHHEPGRGWGAPRIQPYGPLSLDPASACFQYAPTAFEGMKAFRGVDGRPRLFRPDMNMARLKRSLERVALPTFNTDALLELIKILVLLDERWIPDVKGYSLYIRPTVIGTRPSLGVGASDHATLYVILSPTGPYFPVGLKAISLLAAHEVVRSWPGGTGAYKLAGNYAPCFAPQREAGARGYHQVLWLLGEDRHITEAGQMNFFAVFVREDGGLEVATPPLDGTILPGVTRNSVLALIRQEGDTLLPGTRLHVRESVMTLDTLQSGGLVEAFGAGTAAIIAPIDRIGWDGGELACGGEGRVGRALWERIVAIQEGRAPHAWSVPCKTES